VRNLLIHPPFADPTQPYVSLPVLKGHLRAKGLDADILDVNVEAANWLLAPATLAELAGKLEARWKALNRKRSLTFAEGRQYRLVADALPRVVLAADASPGILETFLSRELFFDAARYERARRHADAALEGVSALFHPFRYSFNHASHDVVPWSFDLLDEHARREGPLDTLYERIFESGEPTGLGDDGVPRVDLSECQLVGLSVAFPSQIPEAWRLARTMRRLAPHAFLTMGGPAIHQVAVHLEDDLKARLLALVDGIGLYEGEETLAQLIPLLPEWSATRDPRILGSVPNLLMSDPAGGPARLGPRATVDLGQAAAPDPEGLDLDRYLAPSRALLYAPTRGCYWNKCSFCYYGLSETATAKYREIPPARAAEEMERLSREHDVTYFYVSCDVLSPVYAVKLAQAMIDRGLQLRWSSDLKIEKWFTPERCATLARSGLTAAAFGIESGSDRILELMRKGCDRETMTRVNRDFHAAGIATEWMTFTDHPGESVDEALATIDWVEQERERVDLFIVGEFGLERGSAIFQDPQAFGVKDVWFAEGDELRLYAQFSEERGGRSAEDSDRIDEAVRRLSAGWRLCPYPWAGANSTHHTLLWFMERGQDAFRHGLGEQQRAAAELQAEAAEVGLPSRPRFDLAEIAAREERFFAGYLRKALYTTLPARRGGPGFALAPLSFEHFEEASAKEPALSVSAPPPRR
jgi:anaerobic magnesium-protoporphyrin IX monomethyl ester cyclase